MTGTHTKYLAVSVWANKWGATSTDKNIKIEFKQRNWGSLGTQWAKPTEPTALTDPNIPFNTAGAMWIQVGAAGMALY